MDFYASLFVFAARLVAPLAIFRLPLGGVILAMVVDATDIMILSKFGFGWVDATFGKNSYHELDKLFDIYYLFFEFLVALRKRSEPVQADLDRHGGLRWFL